MELDNFDIGGAVDTISEGLFPGSEAETSSNDLGGGNDDATGTDLDLPADGKGTEGETTAAPGTKPTESTKLAQEPGTEVTNPPATTAENTPPKTWRPEAAAQWANLPPTVQQEILKREEDIFRGLEVYKADAAQGKALQQTLAPFSQLLQASGADPMVMIPNFMAAHASLALGSPEEKQATLAQIAQMYGVELPEAGGEPAYTDPEVKALRDKLARVESQLSQTSQYQQQQIAQQQQAQREKLSAEIDAFAADPKHQYFEEVANDIVAQMKAGAKDLAQAYERAVWANPVTRAKEQARLQQETEAKVKAEAAERAKKAREATAANVRTTAKDASGTAPLGSIDDTLAQEYRRLTQSS